ncbi:MAG TPA: ABC transporter permease [Bryobacteraceae bacterium]|nr:ABC transporter permease [Bryobacteraceae bacterium]
MRRLLRILALRLRSVLRRGAVERELREELYSHIARQTADNLAAGMSPVEARRAALLEIGPLAQSAESCRDARGLNALESILQDIRYGVRVLRKSPLFTTVAIGSLALGIGVNTALFSFMNALVLRSLPVPDAGRLVLLRLDGNPVFSYALFQEIRARQNVFTDVFASGGEDLVLGTPGNLRHVPAALVSGSYASTLGIVPAAGRLISASDERPGAEPVAMLSYRYWREQFGGAADVTSRRVVLNGVSCAIVGVLPSGFFGTNPAARPAIFVPLALEPRLQPDFRMIEVKGAWWLQLMGRLKRDVSPEQAAANLRVIAPAVVREGLDPDDLAERTKGHDPEDLSIAPGAAGYTFLREQYHKPFLLLFAGVAILLLIACANLAAMLLSRGAARTREIAVRLSLGAGRWRILRQLLTEGLLLAIAGGAVGLVVARAAATAPIAFLGRDYGHVDFVPDFRVLAFTAACALLTTVLFAATPAWLAIRTGTAENIRQGSTAVRGVGRNLLQPALIVGEIALCMVLLAAAGLFTETLRNLYRTKPGFSSENLLVLPVDFTQERQRRERLTAIEDRLLERVRSTAGVEAASTAMVAPLSGSAWRGAYEPVGGSTLSHADSLADVNAISPGYFATLRMPLLAGRDFTVTDGASAEKVAIMSRTAAKRFFPQGNAVGSFIRDAREKWRIVGLVGDSHYQTLRETASPLIYFPAAQAQVANPDTLLLVRTAGDPFTSIQGIRAAINQLAPRAATGDPQTMSTIIDDSLSTERMLGTLSLFFSAAAVLLTCIGLYGVVAYSVARRTAEIGIRLALGASGRTVLRMILRKVLLVTGFGVTLGLAAALALSRLVASFLYGVSAHDPWVLMLALGAMVASAICAALVPAIRAARTDPVQALRYE